PGSQVGDLPSDNYVVPDAVIVRRNGVWQAMLASSSLPRLTIHQAYERMIQTAAGDDAGYLKGRLQEARWLLKNLEARGETLLKVVRCLIRQQSGFLEFGARALRPLTLREVAAEIGMHESTVSRAVARKYVHTPRGTIALRDFFASGIDTEGGGEASSVAIQQMIRGLIEAEDPRKPLSDARLAESLKASGVPVARRTVAKYREAMQIAASPEAVRIHCTPVRRPCPWPLPAPLPERCVNLSSTRGGPLWAMLGFPDRRQLMRIQTYGHDIEVTPAL